MATISQTVNIELLEKLPDGTYKRKYPKTVAEQIVQNAGNRFVSDTEKTTWNNKAALASGTATLPSTGWSGPNAQGLYTRTVTISGKGITSSRLVKIGRNYNFTDAAADELMQEAWNLLKAETITNGIRFYSKTVPSVAVPFTWELIY